ncbi:MAG: hypothetical protein AABY26_05255, partial [Nanoarchaeota archaeon]
MLESNLSDSLEWILFIRINITKIKITTYRKLVLTIGKKAVDKAAETLKQFGIPYGCSNKTEKDSINICFVNINEGKI